VLDRIARYLYSRLGPRYKLVFYATQIPASVFVALAVVFGLTAYYDIDGDDLLLLCVSAGSFTALGVGYSMLKQSTELRRLGAWRAPGDDETLPDPVATWDAAANFAMRSYRRNSLVTNTIAAVPSVGIMALVLHLPAASALVLLAAAGIAAAYGTALTYAIAEFLIRPVVADIATALPDDFVLERNGLPIRKRLLLTLPTFTAATGTVVAAFVTNGGGTRELAENVVIAVAVGLALSFELTQLLSRSLTTPIRDLRAALARIREGDYTTRVPVLSSDELGEMSNQFNQMARGLEEREEMRAAFGTYVDRDVAGIILSGTFPADGVEVDVTIMFCDVPSFTPFAESASPREVVAALNELFERIVPIITAHGGHVDKFMGDGVLAVFGAPEGFPDHADRALAAACDIVASTPDAPDGLQVHVGLNTGPVVAGSIGGAGRLNFSVIGDTVNVAARVEAATRDLGDDVLLTRGTRDALQRPAALVSRGTIPLKGKSEGIELFAPADARVEPDRARARAGAPPFLSP